ncbi:hypothetical protein AM493_12815 [Flavobacterium akiainvivens]|uniref:Lipoprotein n=1 Tax=Flavobacterium akiainvivens TaxID=1202724 RepID=A0A0M8MJ11_9FLAO|nr:hypothetical protein [Flavobacterium akiainvivens]KOS06807.1 hypothetical protein AM493_12815 [Flavobacterium akiainvivens]SFQ75313.1 hypothetical protein SAMN05444144_12145 [Flavobacterium akiainvivens]
MRLLSFILLCVFVVCSSCARKAIGLSYDVPELTLLTIGPQVVMQTDDDVTYRTYTFKDFPLTFMFSDSTTSVISYGAGYQKPLSDIFITPKMAVKNARMLNGNYVWNLEQFKYEQGRSIIDTAYAITFGNRRYVYCSFDKHQLSTLPHEARVCYLIDITDPNAVKAVAFPDVLDVDDREHDFFPENGHLCIRFDYYSSLKPKKSEVSQAVLTQDEGNEWVIR